jgi:hypothetical protein
MHIGFFNYYEVYNNNRMFMDASSPIGDDLNYPFVYLGQRITEAGHRVSTIDTDDLDSFDIVCFLDMPPSGNRYYENLVDRGFRNLYLILLESPIIRPDNWDILNHRHFKKVFTWDGRWVDNEKYFKFFLPNKVPKSLDVDRSLKDRLCTMISGNKYVPHSLELYSERMKAIRWFERNHPEDFDLYGIGWNRYRFMGALSFLNRFPSVAERMRLKYTSYRGAVNSKREVLQRYKFAICYENARDINGYITEKIFDCFFAGCVPIYLGAPDIAEYIPEGAFIDRRRFAGYKDLYHYIKMMPESLYEEYLNNIEDLISSNKLYSFSAEGFADNLMNHFSQDGLIE